MCSPPAKKNSFNSEALLELRYTCEGQHGFRITLLILLITWCVKDLSFPHLQRNGHFVGFCSQDLLSNFIIPMCLASLPMASLVVLIIQCVIFIFTLYISSLLLIRKKINLEFLFPAMLRISLWPWKRDRFGSPTCVVSVLNIRYRKFRRTKLEKKRFYFHFKL